MADDLVVEHDDDDDELTRMVREAVASELADLPTDDIDTNDLAEPPREKVISAEDGVKKIEAAEIAGRRAQEADKPAVVEDAKPADAAPASEAPADPLDALLDGLPDDRKTSLRGRIAAADGVLGLFTGREAELAQHGATPVDAVKRFLALNDFAQKKPDEYAAWVLQETGGDKAADLLTKAAEHLGLKITIATDEEDPFEDEEVKRLRAENAALKGRKQFGPDAPHVQAEQVQDAYHAFVGEVDAKGVPVRPLWSVLERQIGEVATAERAKLGRNLDFNDLQRIYADQERALLAHRGFSAAQAAPVEAPKTQTNDAARTARAIQASKSIDGSGPGATRTPGGPPPGATIEQTLAFVIAQEGKG